MAFQFKHFNELTLQELYSIMVLRQKVFVVEQNCAYVDADGVDTYSEHLLDLDNGVLRACSRIFEKDGMMVIGRVVVDPQYRGKGFGKSIMNESISIVRTKAPQKDILIHAQFRLLRFYQELGFKEEGPIFLEDGIEHKKMYIRQG